MKPMRPVSRTTWLLCAALALCALCALSEGAARLPVGAPRALAEARARWATRPLAHYRLELVEDLPGSHCRQLIEVREEVVVAEEHNSCGEPPRTVTGLFGYLASELAQLEGTCGPNGCACDGVWRVRADYDERHGHPTRIRFALNEGKWFNHLWERVRSRGICTASAAHGPDMKITLTPLPWFGWPGGAAIARS